MSVVHQNIGNTIPTSRAVAGMGGADIGMKIEMLPVINVAGTSLPVPRSEFASNSTISVEPVLSMKGLGDIYGMNDRGDVIVISHSQTANFLGNNSTFSAGETRTISRKTKTTSSEKARETDDKVVHLGLFVALLGLLSFVV